MKEHTERRKLQLRQEARYQNADINGKLVMNLRDLSHTMRALSEGRGSQKRILTVLARLGGKVTQRELTEELRIRPGSLSEVVAKLEYAGYIKRLPNEEDRRTVDVMLTESGKAEAQKARSEREKRHERMFQCLTTEEKEQLLVLLEKVSDDWKVRYPNDKEETGSCGNI